MADDIVTRLTALNHPDAADAADEIERLRAEVARLSHIIGDSIPTLGELVAEYESEQISMKRLFSRAKRMEPTSDDSRELALAREVLRQKAEIERLRAAGDVLAEWTAVDHSVEQCEDECEYFAALRAWQEARRG